MQCVDFSLRWFLLLWNTGSRVQDQRLWSMGSVALRHVESSQTRDRTHVPRIGRKILNHRTIRKVFPTSLSTTSKHFSSVISPDFSVIPGTVVPLSPLFYPSFCVWPWRFYSSPFHHCQGSLELLVSEPRSEGEASAQPLALPQGPCS